MMVSRCSPDVTQWNPGKRPALPLFANYQDGIKS